MSILLKFLDLVLFIVSHNLLLSSITAVLMSINKQDSSNGGWRIIAPHRAYMLNICADCYLLSLLCMYVIGLCHRKSIMYEGRARVRCLVHIVHGLHPHRRSNIDWIAMNWVLVAVKKKPNQICGFNNKNYYIIDFSFLIHFETSWCLLNIHKYVIICMHR